MGNAFLIADSLGPRVIKNLVATHNLEKEFKYGLSDVACLIPGVSGINGISTFEIVASIVKQQKPDLIIFIDTLTAKNYHRLGCSFQVSNTSITAGGGMGCNNRTFSKTTLGVDIVSIGVPMMINAKNFSDLQNLPNFIVAPKEIDIYTKFSAECIAKALNTVFYGKNYSKLL